MSAPPSMFLLEIIINVKPNTVHKINLGQTYFPPSILIRFIPAAPSSGRAVLVAVAERPQIDWRVRQYGR